MFTPISVQATRLNADGSESNGNITFLLNAAMANDGEIVVPGLIVGRFYRSDRIAVTLMANTDPDTVPPAPYNAAYVVTENFNAQPPVVYSIIIPLDVTITDFNVTLVEGSPVIQLSNVLAVKEMVGYPLYVNWDETWSQYFATQYPTVIDFDPIANTVTVDQNAIASTSEGGGTFAFFGAADLATFAQYNPAPTIETYIPFVQGDNDGDFLRWEQDIQKWVSSLANPGIVSGVVAGVDVAVDDTDPTMPVVSIPAGTFDPYGAANNVLLGITDPGAARAALHVPMLSAAACVVTSNVPMLSGFNIYDGYQTAAGDEVLLVGQTTTSQNGPWLVQAGAWTRPLDFASGTNVKSRTCQVVNGTTYANTTWSLLTPTAGTVIDTGVQLWLQNSSTLFAKLDGSGLTLANEMRPFNYRGAVTNNTAYSPWDLVLLGAASSKPGARAIITNSCTSGSTGFISSANFIQLTPANIFYATDYGIVANDNSGVDYSVPFNALQALVLGVGGGLIVMPQGIVYGSSPFVLQSLVFTTFNGGWNNSGFRALPGSNCDAVQTSVRVVGTPGAWVSGTNYAQSSLVSYNSKFYYCLWGITNNSTLTPDIDNGNWSWVNSPSGSTNAFFYGLKDCMIHGDTSSPSATSFNNGFASLVSPRTTQGSGDLDFDTEGRVKNVFVRSATGHGFVKIGRSEDVFDECWSEGCGGDAFITSFDTQMVSCKAESYGLGGFVNKNNGDVKWTGLNAFNGGTVPQFASLYVTGATTAWVLSSQNGIGNGTFTITVSAGTTAPIAWNASAATIAAAVSAIAGFSGTCVGSGASNVATGAVTLTFSASQATLTVAQTQTWASGGSTMYLGSLYKAKSAQASYAGVPSTDTTNWQLIYTAPEWGVPYSVIGANAANIMLATCGSNANPAHGLLLRNCSGVNAQVNITFWNATPASVNNPTNPNGYAAVVLDNCTGSIVTAACLGGTGCTGSDLAIINGSTRNVVTISDDGNVSAFLTTTSTAIAGSGNSVVYNGVGLSSSLAKMVDVAISGPSNGQGLFYNSATGKWQNSSAGSSFFGGIFGDGSDGAAVLDGVATVPWATLAGSTYTMTRDCFTTSLTINSGITLLVAAERIFCQSAPVNNGAISSNGNAGTASAGGATNNGGVWNINDAGGAGGTNAAGSAGAAGGFGVTSGGAGGAGSSTAGGAGGARTSTTASYYHIPHNLLLSPMLAVTLKAGSGGGGGGGDGTNRGGGGGGGGGIIAIFAPGFTNNGTISAVGGNGFTPTVGSCGGGGAGSGGLIIIYTLAAVTNTGTITVAGGTPGSGVGTGVAGSASGAGLYLNVVLS